MKIKSFHQTTLNYIIHTKRLFINKILIKYIVNLYLIHKMNKIQILMINNVI